MYEYDYDAEAEIDRLKRKVENEERRTEECQREIARLRDVIRKLYDQEDKLQAISHETLFDSWADFDFEAVPPEAVAKIIKSHDLETVDTISFMSYCAGFAKAAEQFKEDAK